MGEPLNELVTDAGGNQEFFCEGRTYAFAWIGIVWLLGRDWDSLNVT